MQLGARWRAGEAPHRSLPDELRPAVALQESLHPQGESWTLTWLEGRARCSLDDLVTVSLGIGGEVVVSGDSAVGVDAEIDDDWLNES